MTGFRSVDKQLSPAMLVLLLLAAVVVSFALAYTGLMGSMAFFALPFVVAVVALLIWRPKYGVPMVVGFAFLVNGIARYVPAPTGVVIDALLIMTLIAALFKFKKLPFKNTNHLFVWLLFVWFIYTFLEILNPLAVSKEAWLISFRGLSMYMLVAVLLCFLLFSEKKDLRTFFNIWIGFSTLAALWGLKQNFIGPDLAEKIWLEQGGKVTHMIHGKLRIFSFYCDAGQFGAAMAHAGTATLVMVFGQKDALKRIIYICLSLLFFYTMMLSGTRGAIFVPFVGMFFFLLLSKNFKLVLVGAVLGISAFAFLKFTHIGDSNYNIHRMRTAFDSNDPSLLVRKQNQAKIGTFLEGRPFGAGLGSGGSLGARFNPGSYLSQIPFDSWYVKVWVETGIVGLVFHIGILLSIATLGFIRIFKCRDPDLRYRLMALYCGFIGISVASYGNQLFGQSPTIFVLSASIAFIGLGYKMEKGAEANG